jgi:hypothetical protein
MPLVFRILGRIVSCGCGLTYRWQHLPQFIVLPTSNYKLSPPCSANSAARPYIIEAWNVKMASSQDAWYLSLLGLAENFRTSSPPNIKLCIQCLQAVFNFKPPPRVEARTHLQLGNILLTHTKNIDLARTHLEQAVWCLTYIVIVLSLINSKLHEVLF